MTRYRRPPGPTPEEIHDRYLRRQERAGRLAVHVAYAARRPSVTCQRCGRTFPTPVDLIGADLWRRLWAEDPRCERCRAAAARAVELAEELEGR